MFGRRRLGGYRKPARLPLRQQMPDGHGSTAHRSIQKRALPQRNYDKGVHPSHDRPFWSANRGVPPPRASRPANACPYVQPTPRPMRERQRWFFTDMQFEYDPERLIEEVRKRPGIWDYEDAEYRAKNIRYKLWSEVVNELMQADIKVTKSEMRELEIQLQKKWKSIRDCFQKYVTNPNRTKKPYIYCKQLQFLLKDQELPRKDHLELSSDSDEPVKTSKRNVKVWRKKHKLKLVKHEEESSESQDNSNTFDTQDDSRDYSNDGIDTARPTKVAKVKQNQVDEFAFANVDAQIKVETEDPDKMFLLSLLPHLKSIPDEFRLNVKMELMQVLRNANFSTSQHKLI